MAFRLKRLALAAGGAVTLLAGPALAQDIVFQKGGVVQPLPKPAKPTTVTSRKDLARLKTAQGITLQWISWNQRGPVSVAPDATGVWRIDGSQSDGLGGELGVTGVITEIGKDYFLLDGRITITGTPDADRNCDASKVWRFEVTQNRTYYRLREFEWCDGLTDYVDIYFAPRLR